MFNLFWDILIVLVAIFATLLALFLFIHFILVPLFKRGFTGFHISKFKEQEINIISIKRGKLYCNDAECDPRDLLLSLIKNNDNEKNAKKYYYGNREVLCNKDLFGKYHFNLSILDSLLLFQKYSNFDFFYKKTNRIDNNHKKAKINVPNKELIKYF